MQRTVLVAVLSLTVGYLAGHITPADVAGVAHAAQQPAAQASAFPLKTLYWSGETLKKAHGELAARAASGQARSSSVISVRTPTHGMNVLHRVHHGTPRPSNTQKVMSVWDDAEAHAGLSEFLIIMGGSGTMVVDGEIENMVELSDRPGEFRGQPIRNGTSYKLREGDWLVIPPSTAHWPQPDRGGLTYLRMTIDLPQR